MSGPRASKITFPLDDLRECLSEGGCYNVVDRPDGCFDVVDPSALSCYSLDEALMRYVEDGGIGEYYGFRWSDVASVRRAGEEVVLLLRSGWTQPTTARRFYKDVAGWGSLNCCTLTLGAGASMLLRTPEEPTPAIGTQAPWPPPQLVVEEHTADAFECGLRRWGGWTTLDSVEVVVERGEASAAFAWVGIEDEAIRSSEGPYPLCAPKACFLCDICVGRDNRQSPFRFPHVVRVAGPGVVCERRSEGLRFRAEGGAP
jgi:hypothetical protein